MNTKLIKLAKQIYWNNKVMSAWRLCLPVLNVWTHSIQIFTLQTVIIWKRYALKQNSFDTQ